METLPFCQRWSQLAWTRADAARPASRASVRGAVCRGPWRGQAARRFRHACTRKRGAPESGRTWRCETSGEAAAALPFADSFLACAAKRLQQACFSFEGRGRRQHRCRLGNCEAPGGRRHCRRPDARCSVAAAASKVEAAGPSPDKRAARGERNLGLHTAAPGLRSRGRRETVQRLPTAFFTGRSRDASSLSFLSPSAFRLDIQ